MLLRLNSGGTYIDLKCSSSSPDLCAQPKVVYQDQCYSLEFDACVIITAVESVSLYINGQCQTPTIFRNGSRFSLDCRDCFRLIYDAAQITIHLTGIDKSVHMFNYEPVYVAFRDAYQEISSFVEDMLGEIEKTDPGLMTACFSDRQNSPSDCEGGDNSAKSLHTLLELSKDVLTCYNKNFQAFAGNPKHTVVYSRNVVPYEKTHQIETYSFSWIMQNSEFLKPVNLETNFVYKGKNMLPTKILSKQHTRDYNIYENQVVLGFLEHVTHQLEQCCALLRQEIDVGNALLHDHLQSLKNGYNIAYGIIKKSQLFRYKSLMEQLEEVRSSLRLVFRSYGEILPCDRIGFRQRPKFTHYFQMVPHYRSVFQLIVRWMNLGEYNTLLDSYLLSLKTIDKVYEYYCLLKLQELLRADGFVPESKNIFHYTTYADQLPLGFDGRLSNTYYFRKGEHSLVLYYEPLIYSYKTDDRNGIDLYKCHSRSKGDFLSPDFLLKYTVAGTNEAYYAILDAKFSPIENLTFKSELQNVSGLEVEMIKYLLGIKAIDRIYSPVIYMWLLHGKPNKKATLAAESYDNTSINFRSAPSVGIQPLNPNSGLQGISKSLNDDFFNLAIQLSTLKEM